METIYKYNFNVQDEWSVVTFQGAEPIHVGLDPQGTPAVWMRIDTDNTPQSRRLFVVGTGNPMPKAKVQHLGSLVQGAFRMARVR